MQTSSQEGRPALLFNEIDTKNGQFFEIINVGDTTINLDGQSVVLTELGNKHAKSLKVRAVINLSGTTLGPGEMAVISNGNLEGIGISDHIPSAPNAKHWKIFSTEKDAHNWLQVREKNILAGFLIHSPKDDVFGIFDNTGTRGPTFLDGHKKEYVKSFVTDYFVVAGSKSTHKCQLVDEIVEEENFQRTVLDLFLDEHSGDENNYQYLSLGRCESIKPKDLRSFKHGRPRKTSYQKKQNLTQTRYLSPYFNIFKLA